ncbi:MAG: hypothetical protein FWH20_00255 [Oscillospiraceae bacterium]|nr:hypothetical protein [Oscillospiraceae bacterium]
MFDVSQEFMDMARKRGRIVRCEIEVGPRAYTNAEIISFELNDVVHPEDMNFGTACSRRFSFELWGNHSISLTSRVRPYIMFEENGVLSEPCMLGEFFISRRSRQRNRQTITCHDYMSRLDVRYKPRNISFPCTAATLLSNIASEYDLHVGFYPKPDTIENIHGNATVRELIGYIAGLNGGVARFDRYGILQLKKFERAFFTIESYQIFNLSLKPDINRIRRIEYVVNGEIMGAGDGTAKETCRQFNPFGSEAIARRVLDEWDNYSYFGLTMKMQGLPYLEAGDGIWIQDDFQFGFFSTVISEYTLHYDGGLRATLTAKSKNPLDDIDTAGGLPGSEGDYRGFDELYIRPTGFDVKIGARTFNFTTPRDTSGRITSVDGEGKSRKVIWE